MNNIISSSLAFEALMSGKHVMCRPVGDILNFNDLDQFPATIFAKEGYEFCIKIENIEVAGITFTKPLKLDEVQVGDDIYIVQACGEIHHYKYVECHEILNQSIARGFAQRDLENAKLQAEAFCKLFDREYRTSNVIDIPEQSKKRTRKSKIDESNKVQTQTANDVEEEPLEQYTPKLEHTADNLSVEELKRLQVEAEELVSKKKLVSEEESKYQSLLNELLEGVANANTPVEVNAHTRYTKPWTEEQRKPLLTAIHKRLQEIAPAEVEINTPPSLMVQIQNAPDLTALDALEIDVSARSTEIQPKLMDYVKKRRFELENQASEVSS